MIGGLQGLPHRPVDVHASFSACLAPMNPLDISTSVAHPAQALAPSAHSHACLCSGPG